MIDTVLLVFDNFDPVSNYKLALAKEASGIVDLNTILFLFHSYKEGDRVFTPEEKLVLLSSSLPNTLSPKYIIDGDSFARESKSIFKEIERIKYKYRNSVLYLLVDSYEFEYIQALRELPLIFSLTKLIIYIHPEHKYLLEQSNLALNHPLIINSSKELNTLSKASILNPKSNFYSDLILEYINKSSEVAIKRIKAHLSEERFKHSLRVAGTTKQIVDLLEIEDSELRYDVYLAALYHDICKEMPPSIQIQLAKEKLGITEYVSSKVLHGPVASWYLREQYGFNNEDILEAVYQHTIPSEYPKTITMILFLADHLEVGKRDKYPINVYEKTWNLITEKRMEEAFSYILRYCDSKRGGKECDC